MINQVVETTDDQYYNTYQKSILLNTFTESDIFDNYSYISRVNWEIEKTFETPSKKLEFYIDKPETGLKKIDFNIIANNDEIDDINNNKMDFHWDNPPNDLYSNTNHKNAQQEQTTHHSLYRPANSELQLKYDLEDPYGTNDWKSTSSHKGELVIAYNNIVGNKTLSPRVFYVLYIRPSDNGNGHLTYRLSMD